MATLYYVRLQIVRAGGKNCNVDINRSTGTCIFLSHAKTLGELSRIQWNVRQNENGKWSVRISVNVRTTAAGRKSPEKYRDSREPRQKQPIAISLLAFDSGSDAFATYRWFQMHPPRTHLHTHFTRIRGLTTNNVRQKKRVSYSIRFQITSEQTQSNCSYV